MVLVAVAGDWDLDGRGCDAHTSIPADLEVGTAGVNAGVPLVEVGQRDAVVIRDGLAGGRGRG